MAEATEKITINLGVVDLGKIDILVDQGFYANRTDFIKDAIRRSLDAHADDIRRALARVEAAGDAGAAGRADEPSEKLVRLTGALGILVFSRADLERLKKNGRKLRIICAGLVVFAADVTPELIEETVETFKVYGSVRASAAVRAALKRKAPSGPGGTH